MVYTVYLYEYIFLYMYICTCIYLYVRIYIYMCVYTFIHIYVYIHTYIHTYLGLPFRVLKRDEESGRLLGCTKKVLGFIYFSCCFGYLLLGFSVTSFIICMLTLLLMPLAGLHFCVRSNFVTPSL
jgi:hypothetical protein